MSIISRRQKELLLNDVYRMINNNNHTAFANQAKIAECVSNGDLKFFIDSPKKEFVIRYGKKEIRFNCSDQNIKELNAIMFNNNSTIKGISDSTLLPSSNIALSTKGAQQIKQSIDNKADSTHDHDSKYADINHTHSEYADKTHAHSEYANKTHAHSEYAAKTHTHSNYQPSGSYAAASHTHWGMPADKDDFEEAIKTIVLGPKWLRTIKNVFSGIEVASDGFQYCLIAGMQAQISALFSAVAGNSAVDAVQTTSSLGTALIGVSDKLSDVGSFVDKIGKSFESVSGVCKKIAGPINKAAKSVGKAAKTVDKFLNCDSFTDFTDILARVQNGGLPTTGKPSSRLPNVTDVLNQSLLGG